MKAKVTDTLSTIRSKWTEEERRHRQELAGAMQLQLRALVVLSELCQTRINTETRDTAVASAC